MGFLASLRRWRRSGGPPEQVFRRALRHLVAGDDAAAEADLTQYLKRRGDEVEAYLGLAEVFRRRGEVGRAIAMHQNLNLRNDLDGEQRVAVLAGLGRAFESGGYGARAVATFEQVLERDPDHPGALAGLARLLPSQGDFERALVVERRRAKLDGVRDPAAEARLLVRIAERRMAEGRSDVARNAARRALKADPNQVDAALVLAAIESAARRPRQEVGHLVDALNADPSRSREILARLERVFADGAKRRGTWIDFLRDAAKRHADEPTLVDALARALVDAERADDALEVLKAGLVRWPDDDALRLRLGRILLDLGRYDEALTAYESTLDLLEKRGGNA